MLEPAEVVVTTGPSPPVPSPDAAGDQAARANKTNEHAPPRPRANRRGVPLTDWPFWFGICTHVSLGSVPGRQLGAGQPRRGTKRRSSEWPAVDGMALAIVAELLDSRLITGPRELRAVTANR